MRFRIPNSVFLEFASFNAGGNFRFVQFWLDDAVWRLFKLTGDWPIREYFTSVINRCNHFVLQEEYLSEQEEMVKMLQIEP